MKFIVLITALAVTAASARADGLPHHLNDQQFVNDVILTGRCPDFSNAVDEELPTEDQNEALDACWIEFIQLPTFETAGPELSREFRDQVVLAGKCQFFNDVDVMNDEHGEKGRKALDTCFLDFVDPFSVHHTLTVWPFGASQSPTQSPTQFPSQHHRDSTPPVPLPPLLLK